MRGGLAYCPLLADEPRAVQQLEDGAGRRGRKHQAVLIREKRIGLGLTAEAGIEQVALTDLAGPGFGKEDAPHPALLSAARRLTAHGA